MEKPEEQPINSPFLKFGARVLLPALATGLALYYVGVSGAGATQANVIAFTGCYLAGYASLECAGTELKIKRTDKFRLMFMLMPFAGALVAGGLLARTPMESMATILLPLAFAFALPALFDGVRERIKNVQPG